MVNIRFEKGNYKLTMTGHAGYARKGKDIVCAGLSTLFYTLYYSLLDSIDLIDDLTIVDEDDAEEKVIECKPKKESEGTIARTYWVVLKGFEAMSEQFPDYVRYKER